MLNNKSYQPTAFLSKYIDRLYVFEKSSATNFELPAVLPGTGLELVFYLGEPLSVKNKLLPKAHTVCPRRIFHFDKVQQVSFISVRFKRGAFRHFSPIPFSKLNDAFYAVQELWGESGRKLLSRLEENTTLSANIEIIEAFLIRVFHTYHKIENDKWDPIIEELYYNFNTRTIKQVADKANLSNRQFERGFKAQFGVTAKTFQKITRFEDVVKQLLLGKTPKYLDTILDQGYFDQSHFIKTFKSLVQKTPKAYFVAENFETHFYHHSMRESSTGTSSN